MWQDLLLLWKLYWFWLIVGGIWGLTVILIYILFMKVIKEKIEERLRKEMRDEDRR